MAEIQKVHEAFSVDRIEEEIKSRASFLADQQLVHILEECTLQLLQILSIHTVYFLRDIIQFRVERVQVIFTCLDIVVKDLDFLLFFLCKCFVQIEISPSPQLVGRFRCTLVEPILCTLQTRIKVFILVRSSDLFKYGFHHRHVEVHDGSQLYQQTHRYCLDFSITDQ